MDETEIDLRSILGILRRRARLIAVTLAIFIGAAILATFVLTPKYTASVLILVDPTAKNLLDPSSSSRSSGTDSARVDSEVEILKGSGILLSVIENQSLIQDSEFGVRLGRRDRILAFLRIKDAQLPSGDAALQSVISKLKNTMSVRRVGLTYLIRISITTGAPARSAKIANAIAGAYIADQVQSKIATTLTARDILQGRIDFASSAIIEAEEAFDGFINQNIDTITRETGRSDIALIRDELARKISHSEETSIAAVQIQQNLSLGNWLAISQSLEDQAIAELARQRDKLTEDLQAAATDSSIAINLRDELAKIDSDLQERAENGLSSLRQSISNQEGEVSDLRTQLRTTVLGSELPADVLTQIYGLQQNAEIARTQYQTLIIRVRSLDAQAQVQIADSRVVSAALPPSDASFPNTKLILMMAGMVGLGLGIGLAFLYENFVGGYSSEAQIESVLKLAVATSIPMHSLVVKSASKDEILSAADLMHLAPMSVYAESIRRLRANLDHSLRDIQNGSPTGRIKKTGKVIMVSSAIPGEGKSTISLSLGRAYAMAGHKTLVIDCDLRKPSLHRYLGIDREVGLADYLQGDTQSTPLTDIIVSDPKSKLAAIVSSRSSTIPTDQLASSTALSQLIARAKTVFDYVILDSPPLIPVVDGIYLAEHADVVALIVKWSTTSQTDSREAAAILRSAIRPNIDVYGVLNQQSGGRSAYNSRYSAYYGNEST